jgi:transcription-repair coupling factor (superfamily II helicase)
MSVIAPASILSRWAALEELSTALARGVPCLQADGLWGSSRSLVVAALVKHTGRAALLMAPGTAERHRLAEDVRFFLGSLGGPDLPPVLEFPPAEPASWRGRHKDHAAERALACYHLGLGGAIVVATPSALAAPLLSPAAFRTREFSLEVGRTIDRDTLIHRLDAAG